MTDKIHFKPFSATKSIEVMVKDSHFKTFFITTISIKLILIMVCLLFLVGTVSAWNWDNIKSYDEETKTITVINALGLGNDISTIKLDSPQNVYVIRGTNRKVAEFTINNYDAYDNVFNKMEFYDIKKDMKNFERDFTYKYKKSLGFDDVNDYETVCKNEITINGTEEVCHKKLTGTHKEEKFEWVVLDTIKELPKGETTIGIFTTVKPNDNVEWIPTLFGVEIKEWAEWTESLNVDLRAYYKLDNSTGVVYDMLRNYDGTNSGCVRGQTGLLGNCFNVTSDYANLTDIGDFTTPNKISISFWINVNSATTMGPVCRDQEVGTRDFCFYSTDNNDIFFNLWSGTGTSKYAKFSGTPSMALGVWTHIVGVFDGTTIKVYVNGTIGEINGSGLGTIRESVAPVMLGWAIRDDYKQDASMDEIGIWNRDLSQAEVTQLYNNGLGIPYIPPNPVPTVTLNSPTEGFNTTNPTIDFNCTASDDSGITNVSLIINGTIEQTNLSGINGTYYLFTETITTGGGTYNWSCLAYDDADQLTTATVRNFTYSNDLAVAIHYPINAYNSTLSIIYFNGTASDDTAIINVSLYIDGALNETNSSGLNATEYNFTIGISDGTYNWTFEACDVVSCLSATARNLTIDTTPDIHFINPTYANTTNLTSSYVPVNVSLTETYFANITFSFNNGTLTDYFYSDNTRYINVSLEDDSYNYNVTVWTTTGQTNSTVIREITIDTTAPEINITYPLNTTYRTNYTTIDNITVQLNWTSSDTRLDKCWYYNGTGNTTVTCGDNATIYLPFSQYTFIVYANDTFGNENSESITATWDWKLYENSYIFSSNTYDTSTETFSINMSSDGTKTILADLVYNGTGYAGTKTGNNNVMEFNKTITLNQTGNVSFYWSFNYGGEIINSSLFYQNVSAIDLSYCSGGASMVYNFTAWNEEDLSRISPYDFYGSFDFWIGDGSKVNNFSISNASVSYVAVCADTNHTYYTDAKIQYENTGFVKRSYYLINDSNLTSSQEIKLFLLNTSLSTSFIIDVIDDVQLGIDGVYIYIQRYYPGTDEYHTVEMGVTDSSGSTIGHFEAETEDYRIIVEEDGIIIFQSGTQKIFCRETPCTLTFQTEGGIGTTWDDIGVIDQFDWTLDYDESTEVFSFDYTDTSGSIGYGRLYVYYERPDTGKVTICNTTSALLTDTLTCDVTGYNGTIYAKSYLSKSPEILVYMRSIVISALKQIFGFEGLFLMMFILLVLGLAGLWNPAVGIILTLGGIIIINVIGIASFGMITIWGLVIIGLILLWELKT